MRTLRSITISVALVLLFASFAGAVIINFDDITITYPGGYYVQNGYAGLNWENFAVTDPVYTGYDHSPHGAGYYHGMVSPDNVVSNGFADPAFTRGTDFDFIGAYFTRAWNWTAHTYLTIQGYKDGNLVGQIVDVDLNYDTPLWVAANLMNIDEVRFSATGNQFVMDNAEYIVRDHRVPEPSMIMLYGSGLFAAALLRKKFMRS